MEREHHYSASVLWTGNAGDGTRSYTSYERTYDVHIPGKPIISGSSDPAFRGDPSRYNPEELFLAALSSCHMLWYLHLCSDAGIIVNRYEDHAEGTMIESGAGGRFTKIILHPSVTIAGSRERARELHEKAHELCFLANSVNFPIEIEAVLT